MEQAVLEITISSTYFLGIVGTAIGIAWYFSSKLSKMETNINSLQNSLNDMKKEREIDRVEYRQDQKELKDLIYKHK